METQFIIDDGEGGSITFTYDEGTGTYIDGQGGAATPEQVAQIEQKFPQTAPTVDVGASTRPSDRETVQGLRDRAAGAATVPGQQYVMANAQLGREQAAQTGADAQQEAQIANQNYRVEADKNAATSAAAQSAQNIAQMSGAAGAAAAALGGQTVVNPVDMYDAQMNRTDTARQRYRTTQRQAERQQQSVNEILSATSGETATAQENAADAAQADYAVYGGQADAVGSAPGKVQITSAQQARDILADTTASAEMKALAQQFLAGGNSNIDSDRRLKHLVKAINIGWL